MGVRGGRQATRASLITVASAPPLFSGHDLLERVTVVDRSQFIHPIFGDSARIFDFPTPPIKRDFAPDLTSRIFSVALSGTSASPWQRASSNKR
jgi:hypothetical protein